jgi:hypothetical protein
VILSVVVIFSAIIGLVIGYTFGWSQGQMQARLDANMIFRCFIAQQKDEAPKWTRP